VQAVRAAQLLQPAEPVPAAVSSPVPAGPPAGAARADAEVVRVYPAARAAAGQGSSPSTTSTTPASTASR
jgi:hypothetical protein